MTCCYGELSLEAETGRLLGEQCLSLGLAESCTGGMIASRITSVPGSSEYFAGGVVAYDNRIKEGVLGVPADELAVHGAVSREVALSMAKGAQRVLQADIGLSITGIAGPGGGTPVKPVGLVYIALDGPRGGLCRELRLGGDRREIREAACRAALEMLRCYLAESSKL